MARTVAWQPTLPSRLAQTIARFLADGMEHLNATSSPRWGLSALNSGTLRLNAGYTECMTVQSDYLAILVLGLDRGPLRGWPGVQFYQPRGGVYRTVPDSMRVEISLDLVRNLTALLHKLRPSHFAFLDRANRWALGRSIKTAHRNFAVAAIGRMAKRRLAPPPWARSRRDPPPVSDSSLWEGAERRASSTTFERRHAARAACIAHYGNHCSVCGLSFSRRYGPHGQGYIEVHHLTPFRSGQSPRLVDPVRDLRPVCSNCHRMLHRTVVPITPQQLRGLIRAAR
jgi:hypothetical protein